MTSVDDLAAIAGPYCQGIDISQSWPLAAVALARDNPEPDRIEVRAAVKAQTPGMPPAAEVRAALLAQAEKIIAAYAEAGWVLGHAPEFDFSSRLHHAMFIMTGEMVRPPAEYFIGLTLKLSLIRAELAG